ncbi:MAG: hypothetical protein KDD47_15755, partial [Acidobacteria bacterium]|nr:hypothetical protein [Acidobacteriota bacterium]
ASFRAAKQGDRISIRWTTATEVGTVGFRVYEELADGWRRLSSEAIPASGDSTVPRTYRLEVPASTADRFYLESLESDGSSRLYGPFGLDEGRGAVLDPALVPWASIRDGGEPGARTGIGGLSARAAAPGTSAPPEARLEISETGIYRLSFEDLASAGLDFSGVQTAHLALLRGDDPVGLYVAPGAGNGRVFGPGSYLEFYGEALDTLYTTTNVYRLTVDPASARRLATDPRRPGGEAPSFYLETVSRQLRRENNFASPFPDPWTDTRMLTFGGPQTFDFDFLVEDLVSGAGGARLEVDLWGVTDLPAAPDHHVRLRLNGTPVGERTFDGLSVQLFDVELPSGLLHEGSNRLTVELPGDLGVLFDLVNFEGFRVSYPRAFEARPEGLSFRAAGERLEVGGLAAGEVVAYRLEDDGTAVRLTSLESTAEGGLQAVAFHGDRLEASYRVATAAGLLSPAISPARPRADLESGTADLLVISHPRFLEALEPWAAQRRAAGTTLKIVDVDDVYEQWSGGVFDAEAIARYIRFAAAEMGIQGVLLVGGDTYDYRDDLGLGSMSFIPSLYAQTGEFVRFAPVDPLYTDLDGDLVPDLPIGRFPVRTVAELEGLIARTLEYGAKTYRRTAVLSADAFDAGAGVSFTRHSEEMSRGLGVGWSLQKAYLDSLPLGDARGVLLDSINDGVALTSFVGHSGPSSWTFGGLLSTADARGLANAGQPTV